MNGLFIANGRLGSDKNIGEYTSEKQTNKGKVLGASVVDYLLLNDNAYERIEKFKIGTEHESDHYPLLFTIRCGTSTCERHLSTINTTPGPSTIKWDATKAGVYSQHLHNNPVLGEISELCESGLLEPAVAKLSDAITRAATRAGMKRKQESAHHGTSNNPWYDKDCKQAKTKLNKLLRKFRRQRTNSSLSDYMVRKRGYKALIKSKKLEYKRTQLNILMNSLHDSRKFWDMVNDRKKSELGEISPDTWYIYFSELFSNFAAKRNPHNVENVLARSTSCNILDSPFQADEINRAIQKMKSNRSAGIDGIPAELWKFADLDHLLVKLFSCISETGHVPEIWNTAMIVPIHKKGEISDPANYRGISLLVGLSKIYSSVLNHRLLKWASANDFFCDVQNGFRPARSTIDSIFTLHTAVTKEFSMGRTIYCAFVDFMKCFDSIPRSLLFQKLLTSGISWNFVEKLKNLYRNIKAKVRCQDNRLTCDFECPAGVRQGCIMSSSLFVCYLNDLEEFLMSNDVNYINIADKRLTVMLFADDLALVDRTAKGLQRKLNLLSQYCEKWDLSVNVSKTKIVPFRKSGRLMEQECWKYDGESIESVNRFEYLGLLMSTSNSMKKTMEERILKANRAMGIIFGNMKKFGNVPIKIMLKIFDVKIMPVLSYGAEIWGVQDLANIDAVANRFYRILLRLPANSPIDLARGELGRLSVRPFIYRRVLQYWSKLLDAVPGSSIAEAYRVQFRMAEDKIDCWGLRLKNLMFENGFGNTWIAQNTINCKLFVKQFYERICECDRQIWHWNVNNFGGLRTYRIFKNQLTLEPYLGLNLPLKTRNTFTKLRGGLLRIEVNLGRWRGKNYEKRICPLCNYNEIEDEIHVLFTCPVWNCYRDQLKDYSCFREKDIVKLCTSDDESLINYVKRYIELVITEREEILEILS